MNQVASADANSMPKIIALTSALSMVSCGLATSNHPYTDVNEVTVESTSQKMDHAPIDRNDILARYENNGLYVLIDADIDMDGVLDKIVSSSQNAGSELIFFLRSSGGGYRKVLTSYNFTEDGGRILGEIEQIAANSRNKEVISIETFFPKGMDLVTHYITYAGNDWWLSRSVYEVSDWKDGDNLLYRCEVKQNILLRDLASEGERSRINQIPDRSDRNDLCAQEELSLP